MSVYGILVFWRLLGCISCPLFHVCPGQPPDESVRQLLLVATCHIHWDPEFCDVKLIQTMMLMNKLKDIVKESQINALAETNSTNSDDTHSIPLILCGDLNSLPDSGTDTFYSFIFPILKILYQYCNLNMLYIWVEFYRW